jgi:7-cyano-7-deazaguanine synthase
MTGKYSAVLFSGGLDSAVLIAHARAPRMTGEGPAGPRPVVPLYISVGFAWEAEERAMAQRLFAHPRFAGALPPVALSFDMRDVFPPTHWAVRGVPPACDTPDTDVYIDGRNVILLSKAAVFMARHAAAAFAHGSGASITLLLGSLAGNPFPDATPAFFATMAQALSLGLAMPIAIEAPFASMTKAEVIGKGIGLGVPLELTMSCMNPKDGRHCGRCSKCRERRDAFTAAGVPDPTVYAGAIS